MKPNHYEEFLRNGCFFALDSNRLLIGWGEWKKTDSFPELGSPSCSLFTPDFYFSEGDSRPWRTPPHFEVMTREFFASHVLPRSSPEVKEFRWVEPLPESFEKQLREIRKAFETEGLEKAVPVVHAQARELMTKDRLVQVLRAMVETPQSLIPHGFWESSEDDLVEGLLGATPEKLFSIDRDGTISTMALAGTRAKTPGQDDAKMLFNDPKERREHQLVVDDLVERLSRWGAVERGETFIAELPTLFHLKTLLSVKPSHEVAFDEIARALHPTPALGVAPRGFGLQTLKRWDDLSLRGRYGAPFGLALKTQNVSVNDCLVAIRNVQWSGGHAPTLGSGCGIVRESVPENEWAELRLKRDSVKKVLKV